MPTMKKSPKRRERKSHSVLARVFGSMLVFVVVEAVLLVGAIHVSGIVNRIRENTGRMLVQQVENRGGILNLHMTSYWSDVRTAADELNTVAQRMVESGSLDLSDMKNTGGEEFLLEVMPELLTKIRVERASGVFVILNANPIPKAAAMEYYSGRYLGVCVRDSDPAAPYMDATSDLMLERAPASLVRKLNITTTSNWMPVYDFRADECQVFFQPAFEAASTAGGTLSDTDCGYWTMPYTLAGSKQTCFAYTIPLMLDDGTVYGVLGVEIEDSYLYTLLPQEDLMFGRNGSFLLAIRHDDETLIPVMSSNEKLTAKTLLEVKAARSGLDTFVAEGESYAAAEKKLGLYSSNTPFSEDSWVLLGVVPESVLYAFSDNMAVLLCSIVVAMVLAGVLASVLISRPVVAPIRRMAALVDKAEEAKEGIPEFPQSGLKEIDGFTSAIGRLHRNLAESSARFVNIMNMASVDMGGFEMRMDEESVFVTNNFLPLLGKGDAFDGELTVQKFRELLGSLESQRVEYFSERNAKLYFILTESGDLRYVRIKMNQYDDRVVGVVEDVTAATLERMRIEHERDYDLLTGLYNRRAVSRIADELFKKPETMKCAALVMIDLDKLKSINDAYGHELGDQYLRQAAHCFIAATPKATLCARLSGDEFYLLFYGYDDQESIRAHIRKLQETIEETAVYLPDGRSVNLSASCGVAWYPQDADAPEPLMRYADFAMYRVKQGQRGGVTEFDRQAYEQENRCAQQVQEFGEMLRDSLVTYHFQPIVCARTGKVRAYEALMRVNMPTLNNPEQVTMIARSEGRLADLERLTWFKATETYVQMREQGLIDQDTLLFINSLASQHLSEEDAALYASRFSEVQPYVVVEIVEMDHLDTVALQCKRDMPGFSGMFALDDYGSGYNSEKNLLEIAPHFIKVDTSIIRNIDSDVDKQHIVSSIVAYAHRRGMSIVAEGVETEAELDTVIGLEVDLLQGYFLGRPAATPPGVYPEALRHIQEKNEQS